MPCVEFSPKRVGFFRKQHLGDMHVFSKSHARDTTFYMKSDGKGEVKFLPHVKANSCFLCTEDVDLNKNKLFNIR